MINNRLTIQLFLFLTLCFTAPGYTQCCDQPNSNCVDYMNPCCQNPCWGCFAGNGPVFTDPCYSTNMLSRLHYRSIKPIVLLKYKEYQSCDQSTILSAQLRGSAFYGHTNEEDRFGYLARFPTDFRGNDASRADIHDFTVALTYSPISWAHGYWEFLHSDVITFSTDPRQGTNHTQKVYGLLGDLNKYPVYLTVGKKDVSFGQIYTVNPFTPSMTWHYFGPLADGVALGYYDHGFYFEGTLLNGGRGIRVVDTNEKGRLDNWALNTSYEFSFSSFCFKIGGGYLYSTIYDGSTPEHTGPVSSGPRNAIWNGNLEIRCNEWISYFEYTSTDKVWPSTDHVVRTLSFGSSYCLCDSYCGFPTTISFEYGEGVQGECGDEFQKNFQFVFGLDYLIRSNV